MGNKVVRVLLKRNWRTPYGRFPRSIDGIPTEIPEAAVEAMKRTLIDAAKKKGDAVDTTKITGLPSDAVVCGPDYRTPAQLVEDALYHDRGGEMESAAIEARIQEEVNRRLDELARQKPASEALYQDDRKPVDGDDDAGDDDAGEADILDNSVADIVPQLQDLELRQLEELLKREKGGKNRSTLVVEIEAAIEDAQAQ